MPRTSVTRSVKSTRAGPEARMALARDMKLASVALYVVDLDGSVSFYHDLLGLDVSILTSTGALMVNASGSQLYLRSLSDKAAHTTGGIGFQCMIWTAPSASALQHCEDVLKERDAHTATGRAEGFTWVEGRDPSGVPVMVSFPGPDRTVRQEIISRIYSW
ncbi:VOC family protein [Streptomyces sp. NBC_01167]|uniref:VOC family protein n=1 Tax=Streptomyces sp. NBC_01167 TaxID=2903756 RepID=UPI0038675E7C|nr:VOC family protein [Streptomyces sp. NBC_01167]